MLKRLVAWYRRWRAFAEIERYYKPRIRANKKNAKIEWDRYNNECLDMTRRYNAEYWDNLAFWDVFYMEQAKKSYDEKANS